ncbi:Putative Zinc finger C2H2-type [Septoria linicola]|uniref:Zinc finger C2H2-type n=1 Tax=Septoria linicola TaxID=215465 RepID=A0A9Q9AWQ6_9PEZI|nr:putative Zinc finger C2H2-type [Septoria linicola]USW54578.1 Putative Zinc finger C2H2-type [Septoria linicola]
MGMKNNFTIDSKVELLEHLIETSQTWEDPDLASFFEHAQSTFEGFKGTTWEGQDLETKLRKEERLWLAECDGSRSRRRGHEKNSYYDTAMARWKKIWSELLIKDWQNEVDTGRPWDQVPESLREQLVFPELSRPRTAATPVVTPKPKPKVSPPKVPETTTRTAVAQAEKLEFEYEGEKLKRVVDAATQRARETGKEDLAEAVQLIYMDSQENVELRYLLERILQQTANEEQNMRFQDYVRAAKRKIKLQKAQKQQDEERGRRAKKLAHRAEVAKMAGSSSGINTTPLGSKEGEKLCTEKQWSSRCPCAKCKRDKAEFNEDLTGVADAEHRRKYEDFMRKNGLDAGMTNGPARGPPPGVQRQKVEKESPKQQRAADWPVSDIEDEMGGVPIGDTPDAQLDVEQAVAERGSTVHGKANGSPASAENGVLSDSGYETTEKQPHHDPLVSKILGDLQYEPSVEKLLQHNRALSSNANIRDLRQRESALEAIKTIVTETPAAKTDLKVFSQKLQERDLREAAADGEQATVGAEDDSEDEIAESSREESIDQYAEEDDEDVTPSTTRSLRPRTSTGGSDDISQMNSERRRSHKWPCPMSKESGCDQWFSSSGHAVRHGKIHTGVKDYACPECDKAFARKDNMMEHFRGVHKNRVSSNKRGRRASTQSSTAIAEEADRIAAERAAKRRKSARPAARDDSADEASRESSVVSNKSTNSSLTDLSSTDEDRRRPAGQEAGEGNGGLGNASVQTTEVILREQDTSEVVREGMSGAAALNQDPKTVLARLEAKMDALLNNRSTSTHTKEGNSGTGAAGRRDAEHAMVSSAESLLNIATSLQAGALEGQSPELIQFVARLTKTAAEAVIDASNSARHSAEMARDISLLLEQNAAGQGATASDTAV